MTHLTNDQLERMARRDVTPDELLAIARHLETCADCAARGRARAASSVSALRDEFTAAPRARRRAWWLAVAAMIVIAIVTVLALRPETAAPLPRVSVTETTSVPTMSQPQPPREQTEWERLVADARASGQLPFPPELAQLRGSEEVLRGEEDDPQQVSPSGVVIAEVRPLFRWPASGRATVFVFDGERELLRSPELDASRWRATRDLPRGRTLTWQVEIAKGDRVETIPRPPAPPARFRIATAAEHEEIERALRTRPGDHFLHAVLYARAGLRKEADAALRRAKGEAR